MSFFRKALKSLEAIEPQVEFVTQQQHISYHFNGLDDEEDNGDYDEDDDDDDNKDDNTDDDFEVHDDKELSFENERNGQEPDISNARESIEVKS